MRILLVLRFGLLLFTTFVSIIIITCKYLYNFYVRKTWNFY